MKVLFLSFVLVFPALAFAQPTKPGSSQKMLATAYNAVASQTDQDPKITASGAASNYEVDVAIAPSLLHEIGGFGTILKIVPVDTKHQKRSCHFSDVKKIVGTYRIVADKMNTHDQAKLDVMLPKRAYVHYHMKTRITNPAWIFGKCQVQIQVIGHIPRQALGVVQSQEQLAQIAHNLEEVRGDEYDY